jgi:hypothetical protein
MYSTVYFMFLLTKKFSRDHRLRGNFMMQVPYSRLKGYIILYKYNNIYFLIDTVKK